MTPHYRYVVDIEVWGPIFVQKILIKPAKKHAHPFAKRREGHRRRHLRKLVIAAKRSFLS